MRAGAALTESDRAIHEWQMWVPDFGEKGQERLRRASVMVSRCGGVGGAVAFQLAAAGVGRLVLAHAGDLKASDLNRQILMRHAQLGRSRVAGARETLERFRPDVEVEAVAENVNESNAKELVGRVDAVVDCAPLFEERFLMNREAVRQGKPLVEAAMYEMEATLTTVIPGRAPCLACLYPEAPPYWKRQFPVFGAVAATVGSMAAMEAIKVLGGFGEPLSGRLLSFDLRAMSFRVVRTFKDPACRVCGGAAGLGAGGAVAR